MIKCTELRAGNFVLHKVNTRIVMEIFKPEHFTLLVNGDDKNFFPVVLKPEIAEKCGFAENKDYPLLPQAREFKLELPVNVDNKVEIRIYLKSNAECVGKLYVNNLPCSNNFYHLHSLQNLYFSVTGQELPLKF